MMDKQTAGVFRALIAKDCPGMAASLVAFRYFCLLVLGVMTALYLPEHMATAIRAIGALF